MTTRSRGAPDRPRWSRTDLTLVRRWSSPSPGTTTNADVEWLSTCSGVVLARSPRSGTPQLPMNPTTTAESGYRSGAPTTRESRVFAKASSDTRRALFQAHPPPRRIRLPVEKAKSLSVSLFAPNGHRALQKRAALRDGEDECNFSVSWTREADPVDAGATWPLRRRRSDLLDAKKRRNSVRRLDASAMAGNAAAYFGLGGCAAADQAVTQAGRRKWTG
jgi:hypothetical protein